METSEIVLEMEIARVFAVLEMEFELMGLHLGKESDVDKEQALEIILGELKLKNLQQKKIV